VAKGLRHHVGGRPSLHRERAVTGAIYVTLSHASEIRPDRRRCHPLAETRAIVLRLAALFSLDSFRGGFIVQSLLVLWQFHLEGRHHGRRFLRRRHA
jgi:hypothetical protein